MQTEQQAHAAEQAPGGDGAPIDTTKGTKGQKGKPKPEPQVAQPEQVQTKPAEQVQPEQVAGAGAEEKGEPPDPRRFAPDRDAEREAWEHEQKRKAALAMLPYLKEIGFVIDESKLAGSDAAEKDLPEHTIKDEDVPFLALALSDQQLQKIVAIRGNKGALAKWKRMGVAPGTHWIASSRVRCTVNGVHGQELVPGVPVPVEHLDAETTADLRRRKVIYAPGEEGLTAL